MPLDWFAGFRLPQHLSKNYKHLPQEPTWSNSLTCFRWNGVVKYVRDGHQFMNWPRQTSFNLKDPNPPTTFSVTHIIFLNRYVVNTCTSFTGRPKPGMANQRHATQYFGHATDQLHLNYVYNRKKNIHINSIFFRLFLSFELVVFSIIVLPKIMKSKYYFQACLWYN